VIFQMSKESNQREQVAKKRVFVECTQAFFNRGKSGIQKVSGNLADYGRILALDHVEVCPLVWTGFGFCQPAKEIRGRSFLQFSLLESMGKFLGACLLKAPRVIRAPVFLLVERTSLVYRRLTAVGFLIRMYFRLLGIVFLILNLFLRNFVRFREGDIVVLVDSTWHSHRMLETLFKAQNEEGIVLGAMLHDLFPLLLPETCEDVTIKWFTFWFEKIIPGADFFVTNSETTNRSLRNYLESHPELRSRSYVSGSFRLGADLDVVMEDDRPSRYMLPIWNLPGRAILTVGTIEPRKNHQYLLDVYDLLRQRGTDVSLIIVGRLGWKNKDILNRIRSHPDFGRRLLHLDDASDRDLLAVIDRSDCLVCPSIAEGFGLPVIEGLSLGLKVFASDIEVFHEIGGDHCQYFDLGNPDSLAVQIATFLSQTRMSNKGEGDLTFSWPNWEESTKELVQLVLRLSGSSASVSRRG
jgi:glycosyltransferase involved in cell wall biosynthesis